MSNPDFSDSLLLPDSGFGYSAGMECSGNNSISELISSSPSPPSSAAAASGGGGGGGGEQVDISSPGSSMSLGSFGEERVRKFVEEEEEEEDFSLLQDDESLSPSLLDSPIMATAEEEEVDIMPETPFCNTTKDGDLATDDIDRRYKSTVFPQEASSCDHRGFVDTGDGIGLCTDCGEILDRRTLEEEKKRADRADPTRPYKAEARSCIAAIAKKKLLPANVFRRASEFIAEKVVPAGWSAITPDIIGAVAIYYGLSEEKENSGDDDHQDLLACVTRLTGIENELVSAAMDMLGRRIFGMPDSNEDYMGQVHVHGRMLGLSSASVTDAIHQFLLLANQVSTKKKHLPNTLAAMVLTNYVLAYNPVPYCLSPTKVCENLSRARAPYIQKILRGWHDQRDKERLRRREEEEEEEKKSRFVIGPRSLVKLPSGKVGLLLPFGRRRQNGGGRDIVGGTCSSGGGGEKRQKRCR